MTLTVLQASKASKAHPVPTSFNVALQKLLKVAWCTVKGHAEGLFIWSAKLLNRLELNSTCKYFCVRIICSRSHDVTL